MPGEDSSYPGVQLVALQVAEDRLYHRYFLANYLKLLTTPTLPTEKCNSVNLPSALRSNTSCIQTVTCCLIMLR